MQFARALMVTLGMLSLAACSGDSFADKCKDGCETVCDGQTAPTAAEISECKTSCDKAAELNSKAGCEDEADKLASCGGDECSETSGDECNDEGQAYVSCIFAYCLAHADDAVCQS